MKSPETPQSPQPLLLTTRIAFSLVFIINVQCALAFAIMPENYIGAYELSGTAGEAAIRGIGIAFLMWNATYPAFIASPQRFPVLGWVILAQQIIGLAGECLLLTSLPVGHDTLITSIWRFIAFDGGGLVIMLATFLPLEHAIRRGSLERVQ